MVEDGGLRLRRRAAGEQQHRRVVGLVGVRRRVVGDLRAQLVEPRLGLVGLDEVAGVEPVDQRLLLGGREPVVQRRVGDAGPGGGEQRDRHGLAVGVGEGERASGAGSDVGRGGDRQAAELGVGQVPDRSPVAHGVGGEVEQHGDVRHRSGCLSQSLEGSVLGWAITIVEPWHAIWPSPPLVTSTSALHVSHV